MASVLRRIVAGPRNQHPEASLDLCYVTDDIIATSGPSSTYPKRAYRNPTEDLVRFLDSKHGEDWSIFEFRAEGTGYPDDEVYGRIHHFPWPDHHPPPFGLIPSLMASMRNWINGEGKGKRVAVVHCKAGKGRSGTVACSYLISEQGWSAEDAMKQFTERRMRAGFGAGVSIPSQVRWVNYVERWKNVFSKIYVERPVEIVEIHIWGLRKGLKIDVEGFVDEGRKIKRFHRFGKDEFFYQNGGSVPQDASSSGEEEQEKGADKPDVSSSNASSTPVQSARELTEPEPVTEAAWSALASAPADSTDNVVLRPKNPVIVPTSDVNIDFERRAVVSYTDWSMITSVGHVWFNAYFEGGHDHDSGVFEIDWEAMDGIKGTSRKGIRSLERLKVVWRYHKTAKEEEAPSVGKEPEAQVPGALPPGKVISEPGPGEEVPEGRAADWRGQEEDVEGGEERELLEPLRQQEEGENKESDSAAAQSVSKR